MWHCSCAWKVDGVGCTVQCQTPPRSFSQVLCQSRFSSDGAQVMVHNFCTRLGTIALWQAGRKCEGCNCDGGISTANLVPLCGIGSYQTYWWQTGQSCWGDLSLSTLYPFDSTPELPKQLPLRQFTLKSWILSGMIWSKVAWGQALLWAGFAASAISATVL